MGSSVRSRPVSDKSISLDKAGNVYVTGSFTGTQDFDPGAGTAMLTALGGEDAFLAKYDSSGNYIWAKRIMGGTNHAYGYSLAISTTGNVCVTGNFYGTSYFNTASGRDSFVSVSSSDIFLTQYDSKGNYMWAKCIRGDAGSNAREPHSLTVDRVGNLYLTGYFGGSTDFDPGQGVATLTTGGNNINVFLAKYDSNGNYLWANKMEGSGNGEGFSVTLDTAEGKNNIYIIGAFSGTTDFDPGTGVANLVSTGDQDVFIAKYDNNGRYMWAEKIGGPGPEMGSNIATDRSGNVYITGIFMSPVVDFDPGPDTAMLTVTGIADMFLAKYDAGGNYVWAKSIGGIGGLVQGQTIALDELENIYVLGSLMGGGADFDPGPGTAMLAPAGLMDVFIAKYDACNHYIWAGSIRGSNAASLNFPAALVLNPAGDVYIHGDFNTSADFDPGTATALRTAVGDYDDYLLKLHFSDTPGTISYLTVTACSDSYTLNGTVYTSSGVYMQLLPGITSCDSIVILDLTLNASIDEPVINVNGFELGVAGTYATYQWIKNGVPIPGATGSTYMVTENADYQVAVTNEMSCTDTSAVYTVTNYTGIEDAVMLARQIRIYPNPARSLVYVNAPLKVNIRITDVTGKLIKEQRDATSVPISGLAKGIYLLNITDKTGVLLKVEKLVKAE